MKKYLRKTTEIINTENKLIIDVDTEQSLWHTQRVARRVCEMVGSNYELYLPFPSVINFYNTSISPILSMDSITSIRNS